MKAKLVVYVRADCHLCEDMVVQLHELQAAYLFDIEYRDVDLRPAWCQSYGDKIPLLLCGGVEICRYFLDLRALQTALRESIVGARRQQ